MVSMSALRVRVLAEARNLGLQYVAFSEACHQGFSLDTQVSFPPSTANGFSQLNKAKINVI